MMRLKPILWASPTGLTIVLGNFNAAVRKQQDMSEHKLGKFMVMASGIKEETDFW